MFPKWSLDIVEPPSKKQLYVQYIYIGQKTTILSATEEKQTKPEAADFDGQLTKERAKARQGKARHPPPTNSNLESKMSD